MIKIPKAAMPVVEVLRRDVPRPRRLPSPYGTTHLRWGDNVLTAKCPMGLHKNSTCITPVYCEQFDDGLCSDKAVAAFYTFWDKLTDAGEAVDAVWPKTLRRQG